MGNYLAQPNCAKNSASGASCRVGYGVSSMQGWRVSMEDSHVIYHRFPSPTDAQLPRKKPLPLPSGTTGYTGSVLPTATASTTTATSSPSMIETSATTKDNETTPTAKPNLKADPSVINSSEGGLSTSAPTVSDIAAERGRQLHLFGIFDGHGGPQVARFASNAIIDELQKTPQFKEGNFDIAFKVAYCNIDRILRSHDWPNKHEEFMASKINDGRSDDACHHNDFPTYCMLAGSTICDNCACPRPKEATQPPEPSSAGAAGPSTATAASGSPGSPSMTATSPAGQVDCSSSPPGETDLLSRPIESIPGQDGNNSPLPTGFEIIGGGVDITTDTTVASAFPNGNGQQQSTFAGTIASGLKHVVSHLFNTATSRFGGNGGGNVTGAAGIGNRVGDGSRKLQNPSGANGKQLRQHANPAMYAGCTAVCALLAEDILYVANAGDSRAVLCRGGRAETLSKDHKPTLPEERQRIYSAGGFVEYGRVNGNLNLSRALGDLAYKQDMSLPPEKQIVTGYPDVRKIQLLPEDEFIVLGCDGIWELFSSQDVVDFVRQRLRPRGDASQIPSKFLSGSSSSSSAEYAPRPASRGGEDAAQPKPPHHADQTDGVLSKTLEELFESLLSPNPQLFEFGCDNMTAVLVDLRPGSHCSCGCHAIQRETYQAIFPPTVDQSDITLKQDKIHYSSSPSIHTCHQVGPTVRGSSIDKESTAAACSVREADSESAALGRSPSPVVEVKQADSTIRGMIARESGENRLAANSKGPEKASRNQIKEMGNKQQRRDDGDESGDKAAGVDAVVEVLLDSETSAHAVMGEATSLGTPPTECQESLEATEPSFENARIANLSEEVTQREASLAVLLTPTASTDCDIPLSETGRLTNLCREASMAADTPADDELCSVDDESVAGHHTDRFTTPPTMPDEIPADMSQLREKRAGEHNRTL